MNTQTTIEILLGYNDGNGFFFWPSPRLYTEDPRPAESLEMAVEDD
jgi:hypothetical protein